MLACGNRLLQQRRTHLRGRRIEKNRVGPIGQRGIEIRGPAFNAVRFGKRADLFGIAPHQDGIGHQPIAVRQSNATFGADRKNRSDQMLIRAHPAGDAVHDNSHCFHVVRLLAR